MSGLSKGEKWLARVMVPGFVGVAALCYLAWRPCEPRAQAAVLQKPAPVEVAPVVEAPVLTIPTITIVAAAPSKGVAKGAAGVSRKPAMVCTDQSPEWHCWSRPLAMGTVNTSVQECDCSQ
jgi:hypothetical protein